jgi:hypothetical protein
MIELPIAIRVLYRTVTTKDVRSWSFGAVIAARRPDATSWKDARGTLNDQSIFGPTHNFSCACGKFEGVRHEKKICDRCGVKLASAEIRRSRFGHVDLTTPTQHLLGRAGETIEAFPIIPAAFFESLHGERLPDLYDDLIRANGSKDAARVATVIDRIARLLVPILVESHNWNLQETDIFARGLALISRSEGAADAERCDQCGYPLHGVAAEKCPGCGGKIDRT